MSKRLNRTALSIMMLILLTACAQETTVPPAQTEPPAPAPTPPPVTQQPSPEQPAYSYTAPLTGMGTNEPVDRRPIMVMVNNAPPARPQSGLDKADIVYELLAEGEMTRFVAIYQSQRPKVIGPVRSIRPYFIQLGAGFDAVMIHAGGSPEALETLATPPLTIPSTKSPTENIFGGKNSAKCRTTCTPISTISKKRSPTKGCATGRNCRFCRFCRPMP